MTEAQHSGPTASGLDGARQAPLTSKGGEQSTLASSESVEGLTDVLRRVSSITVDGAPGERLAALHTVRRLLDEARTLVDEAVVLTVVETKQDGASWAAIGRAAGVSRQAAQQRWGSLVPTRAVTPVADVSDVVPVGTQQGGAADPSSPARSSRRDPRPWREEVTLRLPGLPLPALRVQVTHRRVAAATDEAADGRSSGSW